MIPFKKAEQKRQKQTHGAAVIRDITLAFVMLVTAPLWLVLAYIRISWHMSGRVMELLDGA